MNDVRFDLLLILDNGAEELGIGGIVLEKILDSLPKLKWDGSEHFLSAPSKTVAVKVAYRKKISFSVPNPCSCKFLDPLGYFIIFRFPPVI